MSGNVIGRFAPSPSGRMHLGNAFCALLAWLSARSQGGKICLRVEDLDPDRCRMAYAKQLEDDLRWLGLDWDLGGTENPEYCQRNRTDIYASAYAKLEQSGLLYPCYCTRAERASQAPHASDGRVIYNGRCRNLTREQRERLESTRCPAIRIQAPLESYTFLDGVQGVQTGSPGQCGDFIVRRADGVYAYQLAVVVDDALMGVTEVVRGMDLIDSTHLQLYLYRLFHWTPPKFYHIPLLLAPDGKRLSKRDRDLDLGCLRLHRRPEELIGLLAYLGGLMDVYAPVTARELVSVFSWERVKGDSIVLPEDYYRW